MIDVKPKDGIWYIAGGLLHSDRFEWAGRICAGNLIGEHAFDAIWQRIEWWQDGDARADAIPNISELVNDPDQADAIDAPDGSVELRIAWIAEPILVYRRLPHWDERKERLSNGRLIEALQNVEAGRYTARESAAIELIATSRLKRCAA